MHKGIEMATTKASDHECDSRDSDKTSGSYAGSRQVVKSNNTEHLEGPLKKQTRARTRATDSEEVLPPQFSLCKAREKVRAISELNKEIEDPVLNKGDIDNSVPSKKESDSLGSHKKDVVGTASSKKEIVGSLKKDVNNFVQLKKDSDGPTKKGVQSVTELKKENESAIKKKKLKVKMPRDPSEKATDDLLCSSKDTKSRVVGSEKSTSKESKLKIVQKENSSVGKRTKTFIWTPGDLAWGRVGQYPYWPCMIAIDHLTNQFARRKRGGRLNSVQERLHVQFFGDNGRHSWIPASCVMKYEGKDHFQTFGERVIQNTKKKNKRFTSAFIVKPSCKVRWEVAIAEAEESVTKTREQRIKFFRELLNKKSDEKSERKAESSKKGESSKKVEPREESIEMNKEPDEPPRGARLVKKKRSHQEMEEIAAKQMKFDKGQVALKIEEELKKDNETNVHTKKKRSRNVMMQKQNGAGK